MSVSVTYNQKANSYDVEFEGQIIACLPQIYLNHSPEIKTQTPFQTIETIKVAFQNSANDLTAEKLQSELGLSSYIKSSADTVAAHVVKTSALQSLGIIGKGQSQECAAVVA